MSSRVSRVRGVTRSVGEHLPGFFKAFETQCHRKERRRQEGKERKGEKRKSIRSLMRMNVSGGIMDSYEACTRKATNYSYYDSMILSSLGLAPKRFHRLPATPHTSSIRAAHSARPLYQREHRAKHLGSPSWHEAASSNIQIDLCVIQLSSQG